MCKKMSDDNMINQVLKKLSKNLCDVKNKMSFNLFQILRLFCVEGRRMIFY
jgi:hypothetical protein